MRRRKIKALIFDFDGTLVDASRAICVAFNNTLTSSGFRAFPESEVRRMIGRPLTRMFSEATRLSESSARMPSFIDEYRRHFRPISQAYSKALPGVPEMARLLMKRNTLGIATSRISDGAIHILEGLGLLECFTAIVGLEHVSNPKPHPEAVLKALDEIRAHPDEAAMVGDTVDDIVAGREAGLMTVGVTTGASTRQALEEAGADSVLDHMSELVEIVNGTPDLKQAPPNAGEGRNVDQ